MKKIWVLVLAMVLTMSLVAGCAPKSEGGFSSTAGTADATLPQLRDPEKGQPIAIIKTEGYGDIKLMLFPEQAPKAVENFITHAKNGYYDGVTFHRVIENFMIQSGDPLGNGTGGESIWKKPFVNEISDELYNFNGALCMANSGPDTNGSQFYIVQAHDSLTKDYIENAEKYSQEALDAYEKMGGAAYLDGGYTVFGQVIGGMKTVNRIAETATGTNDKPVKDIVIDKIQIIE